MCQKYLHQRTELQTGSGFRVPSSGLEDPVPDSLSRFRIADRSSGDSLMKSKCACGQGLARKRLRQFRALARKKCSPQLPTRNPEPETRNSERWPDLSRLFPEEV